MDLNTPLQTTRRATVGRSALGWVALACLCLNGAFWGMLMWDLLAPRQVISPQTLQAGLAIVAFALVLPLFWSMLLPSSPAGRLLQKQTWATPGYVVTAAAAVFLTYTAYGWLRLWWLAQAGVVEAGQDRMLTITSLIAGILVPALAWCVTTPEQWIAAIEQARHVKRIEHAMKMEEAAMRAAYARAVSLLHADLTNLTIEQRRELAGILGTFAQMQQHSMQQIAASWKDMYNVECQLATVPDQQLLTSYQEVAGMLADGAEAMSSSAAYATEVRTGRDLVDRAVEPSDIATARSTAAHQDTADRARPVEHGRVIERSNRPTSGPAAARPVDHERPDDRVEVEGYVGGRVQRWSVPRTPHDQAFHAARNVLSGAWKRIDLENVLSISKTQAGDYITAWIASGDVESLTEPKYHYQWVSR